MTNTPGPSMPPELFHPQPASPAPPPAPHFNTSLPFWPMRSWCSMWPAILFLSLPLGIPVLRTLTGIQDGWVGLGGKMDLMAWAKEILGSYDAEGPPTSSSGHVSLQPSHLLWGTFALTVPHPSWPLSWLPSPAFSIPFLFFIQLTLPLLFFFFHLFLLVGG